MTKEIKKVIELVKAEKINEAFIYGAEKGVFVAEDWVEEDGIEYYDVYVEDERFRFEVE